MILDGNAQIQDWEDNMKNFYREREPLYTGNDKNYDQQKRSKVLSVIKPICDVFEIKNYDYVLNEHHERLIVEGQAIGCRGNSIGSIVMELINYIWLNSYAENRCLGAFEKQTIRQLKCYWIQEEK